MYQKIEIYCDGGARSNPGPAGVGVAIWQGNNLVAAYKKYIGRATNNQAEYQAVLFGLEQAKRLKAQEVAVFMDSQLVASQLNQEFKIKNQKLAPFFIKIWNLSQDFKKVTYHHIPREQNRGADQLVNQAIDEGINNL